MLRVLGRNLFQNNLRAVVQVPSCEYAKKPPKPRKQNPVWFVKQQRAVHDEFVTADNKDFVSEVVNDRFGVPTLIKGVETFPNAVDSSQLLKIEEAQQQFDFTARQRRCGVLARKIGVVPLWHTNGKKVMTTMLHIEDNHVIKYTPPEDVKPNRQPNIKNLKKFGCLVIGASSADPFNFTKEYCGLFKDSGVMPKRHLGRFYVTPEARLLPGTPLNVTHFRLGDFVDVSGTTIDRGFQGVMKRWGFKGQPATHGQTKTHRRPGCIGINGMARVWKGKKMPGHMGNRLRTAKGLQILRINTEYNVLWVTGKGIPGETGSICRINDTMLSLKRKIISPPCPTNFADIHEHIDLFAKGIHNFSDPTISFEEQ